MERVLSFISGVKRREAADAESEPEAPESPLQPLPAARRSGPMTLPSIGEDATFSSPRRSADEPLTPSARVRRMSEMSMGSNWSSWSSSESGSRGSMENVLPSLTEPSQWRMRTSDPDMTLPTNFYTRLTKLSTAHGNRFPMCFPRSVKRDGLIRMVTSIFLDVFPGETRDANTKNRVLTHAVTGMGAADTKEESKNEAARSALHQLCLFAAEAMVDFGSRDTDEALPHLRKLFRSVARHIFGMRVSFEIHEHGGRAGLQRLYQAEITVWPASSRKHKAKKDQGTTVFSDTASSKDVATRLGLHAGFEWAADLLD